MIGGQASHAWAEVLIPGSGWIGFDPTLGAPVGLRHVRVAYGRDYGDAAPVRGVYKGHAGQHLSVDVRVRPALDDEGREQLAKTAAAPPAAPVIERPQQLAQQQYEPAKNLDGLWGFGKNSGAEIARSSRISAPNYRWRRGLNSSTDWAHAWAMLSTELGLVSVNFGKYEL